MNKKLKIIITDFIADTLDVEKAIAGDEAEVLALNATSEQELEGNVEDADDIMMYHTVSLTAKTIKPA